MYNAKEWKSNVKVKWMRWENKNEWLNVPVTFNCILFKLVDSQMYALYVKWRISFQMCSLCILISIPFYPDECSIISIVLVDIFLLCPYVDCAPARHMGNRYKATYTPYIRVLSCSNGNFKNRKVDTSSNDLKKKMDAYWTLNILFLHSNCFILI